MGSSIYDNQCELNGTTKVPSGIASPHPARQIGIEPIRVFNQRFKITNKQRLYSSVHIEIGQGNRNRTCTTTLLMSSATKRHLPCNYKHNVWTAGFEPAIYQFQTEDVGQATLRPDIVLISKLVRVTGIEPVLQRSGRHRLPNAIYPVKRTKK